MTAPRLATRAGVTTLCRRIETDHRGLGDAIDGALESVGRHLHARQLAPAGPPCICFRRLDLPRFVDAEPGFPVDPQTAAAAQRPLRAGAVPAGEYLEYEHVGDSASMPGAHAIVRGWARARGLRLLADAPGAAWSGVVEWILTVPEDEARPERWRTRIAYLTLPR